MKCWRALSVLVEFELKDLESMLNGEASCRDIQVPEDGELPQRTGDSFCIEPPGTQGAIGISMLAYYH